MRFKNVYFTFFAFLAVACSTPKYFGIDYHVHITSQEMAKEMEKLCGTVLMCPDGKMPHSNANEIEKSLDSTIFNRAVVLSGAYFAGMPEMELDIETQRKLTRSENEFIAHQVSSSEKMYGFFSINPLAEYAAEESRYWVDSGKFHGIKLHFGNSNFDYRNANHIKKMQDLLKLIDSSSMYVMLHGRTRNPEFGKEDMDILINEIIPYAPETTWILAHAGGWGGYDDATDAALTTIIDALNSNKLDKSKIYIDLSAIVVPESDKKNYPISRDTLENQTRNFINRFHTLDNENWIFGSDWVPNENDLEPYYYFNELMRAGLNEQELKRIISNKLDFIE
ncbi:amidohydrolase family protein [Zobellia barbeyronii]|uniref:Amidohydrolase family protein n=1 Tax=Zobellia barbeyronii TaxID=2748009 RepID=A0ABS5WL67_9FLAO|nr:amidohydrolase family protein [Zobellia barbeyronii]MBT2163646.1 amidohydrolase family protein [Zobellia barbeyronii]